MNLFVFPSALKAVFTNLNATGRYGPTMLASYYTGQDHDGQVTLSSGIQQRTVPYTGDYRIEAVGAAGGYDKHPNSLQYRGRGESNEWKRYLALIYCPYQPIRQRGENKQIDNGQLKFEYSAGFAVSI